MVHANTLVFLRELAENNSRDWFDAHRKRYEAAKKDVQSVVNQLLSGIAEFDAGIAGLTAKDCMFRIFRDTRFSNNKAPYKTNLGGWMAPGGRKSLFGGYYFHVQPDGNSFLAGGIYHPESKVLKAVRDAIDYDGHVLRELVDSKPFQEHFGGLGGDRLKTSPQGFSKEHPHIELLRQKDFVVSRNVSDAEITSPDFLEQAIGIYRQILPLNNYLNKAIGEISE